LDLSALTAVPFRTVAKYRLKAVSQVALCVFRKKDA